MIRTHGVDVVVIGELLDEFGAVFVFDYEGSGQSRCGGPKVNGRVPASSKY